MKTQKWNGNDVNCGNTNEIKIDVRSCDRNLNNYEVSRKKEFRGFNRIRTLGLCVRAALLYQLSYEDPYMENRPI